jgi:hypothetical protein
VQLQLQVAEGLPAVQGDRVRLQLCFENLLTWAGRALEPGTRLQAALELESGAPVLGLRTPGFAPGGPPVPPRAHLALALAADVAAELGGTLETSGAAAGVGLRMRLGPPRGGAHGHAAPGG